MKQYIIIAFFGCCIQLQAQTTANDTTFQRMMTLEKEYSPIIDKASKINTLPEVREPQAPQARIEYSNYSVPVKIKPEPSNVDAAQYFDDLEKSNQRGYVKAGVSTFIDIDGDAGYQILNNETDELSVWLSHRSSSGKIRSLQTDKRMKFNLNDNTGAFRYSHHFDLYKVFADAKYTYSKFNYYGSNSALMPQSYPDQVNNIFDANVGIHSKDTDPLDFLLKLNYTHFGQKESLFVNEDGPKENKIKIDFDIYRDFDGDKLVGLAGYSKMNFYSTPNDPSFGSYKNYSDLNVNPYFRMEGDEWSLRLGFMAHLLAKQSKKFHFSPDVEFFFRPYETGLLYLTAKGAVDDNSNSNIFYENRYVVPEQRILDSYTGFDGTAGFKTSISGMFAMDFFFGYKATQREHFYLPNTNHLYDVDYSDTKVFKIGTNLKYQYEKMFDIGLKATYYNWNVDKSDVEAWNKPTIESDLTAGFQFQTIPLRIDLNYHLEVGRKSFDTASTTVVDMKNINDLSLTETYIFNDTFSVFARIDNLLAQKYDIWYGYPVEGIRFMGGLSVKF